MAAEVAFAVQAHTIAAHTAEEGRTAAEAAFVVQAHTVETHMAEEAERTAVEAVAYMLEAAALEVYKAAAHMVAAV
jgi:hypothetical protein